MGYLRSIALMLSMVAMCIAGQAQTTGIKSSQIEIIEGKSYFIHTVEKGQTLYAISKLYSVPVSVITSANDIQNGQLKHGTTIRVPQFSEQKKMAQKVTISGQSFYLHKVKKGETLFSIGRSYELKPAVILAANPESSANLNEGTVLRIPAENSTHPNEQYSAPEPTENYPNATSHTVAKGESLYSIAKHYGTSVAAIIAKNPACREGLRSGSVLTIPLPPKKRSFLYHVVVKGDTYYSIAKHYGTSPDQIQKDNPAIKSNLKEKMVLKVEKTDTNQSREQIHSEYSFHEISSGETFYSISKQYDIIPKKLKKLNADVDPASLSIGYILMVPKQKTQFVEEDSIAVIVATIDSLPEYFSCDSLKPDSTKSARIALLLPLFLTANDTISQSENIIRRQEKVHKMSLPFVEFYEGMLIALDSLKKQGYNVDLTVYDTEKDTNRTKEIMLELDLEKTDLIIGPVYSHTFSVASEIAKQSNVPIVSPLSSSTSDIVDNPYALIVNTPQKYRIETAALYVSQNTDYNFLMIHNGGVKDFELMDIYKDVLFSSFADSAIFADIVFKELNFSEQGIEGVQDALSISSKNIVIIPSQNQGFVNNIVTQLYQFHKKYDVDLLGLSVWEKYDNIELEYLFGLNYQFGTNYFVDYNKQDVKNYVEKYRSIFKTEPSKYSFHGYDVCNFFIKALEKYPLFLCECVENIDHRGLQSNFELRPYEVGKGLVNTNVSLVKYSREYQSELIEFDAQTARKAFYDRQKDTVKEAPLFEELFTE